MSRIGRFGVALLLAAHVAPANTIHSNPVGGLTGGNPWVISTNQFVGARFTVASAARLNSAAVEFNHSSSGATFFVAVVPLSSLAALPVGTSGQAIPFNPGEVAFSTTFARVSTGAGIETVPLGFDVPPGVYGIVFGSGFFGTAGSGGTPPYTALPASTGLLRTGPPGGEYVWRNSGTTQFNVSLAVGPPAVVPPVIAVINSPRQVVPLGQGLGLNATATGATAYQWKRNGRPIPGATGPSHAIVSATPLRDAGWYQVIASNAAGATPSPVVFVNVSVAGSALQVWGPSFSPALAAPTGFVAVAAVTGGNAHSLALRDDGTVAIGGDTVFYNTPPPGLSEVVAVAAGGLFSLALKSDGTVAAWGFNGQGQTVDRKSVV